ncbi:MAG: hypothetical protein R3D69_13230 [Xanthobacteraceae bacterium]
MDDPHGLIARRVQRRATIKLKMAVRWMATTRNGADARPSGLPSRLKAACVRQRAVVADVGHDRLKIWPFAAKSTEPLRHLGSLDLSARDDSGLKSQPRRRLAVTSISTFISGL